MIIPLGADRPLKRPTLVNHALVAANVLVFVVGLLLTSRAAPDSAHHALDRLLLNPAHPAWWQFFTYQFLHAGPLHLAGNMLFLWTFGPNVEDRFGRLWYLAFYLVGGAAAGGLHCLMSMHPVLGASGAVAAVTGAYLVLFPRTLIKVFVFFLFIGVFQVPAGWFLAASLAWDLVFRSGGGSNVAVAAHVGGYLFGAVVSVVLLWTRVLPRETYDLFSIAKHAKRRRDFRAITAAGAGAWTNDTSRVRATTGQQAAAADALQDALAERRAKIAALVADKDGAALAGAYREYLAIAGRAPLPRAAQLDAANLLFASGERDLASEAYAIFIEKHPRDPESPRVRLMLALISARYLNDPVRAKALLAEAKPMLTAPDQVSLADELLAELG